jgi:hypothetical protein
MKDKKGVVRNGKACFKNVNNCLNTNSSSNLETSGGKRVLICIYMILIFSTPELIKHLWQLKTVVFLHFCLIHAVLLLEEF